MLSWSDPNWVIAISAVAQVFLTLVLVATTITYAVLTRKVVKASEASAFASMKLAADAENRTERQKNKAILLDYVRMKEDFTGFLDQWGKYAGRMNIHSLLVGSMLYEMAYEGKVIQDEKGIMKLPANEQKELEEKEDRILEFLRRTPTYGKLLDDISKGTGFPNDEAERVLNRLAKKGLVLPRYGPSNKLTYYWLKEVK